MKFEIPKKFTIVKYGACSLTIGSLLYSLYRIGSISSSDLESNKDFHLSSGAVIAIFASYAIIVIGLTLGQIVAVLREILWLLIVSVVFNIIIFIIALAINQVTCNNHTIMGFYSLIVAFILIYLITLVKQKRNSVA